MITEFFSRVENCAGGGGGGGQKKRALPKKCPKPLRKKRPKSHHHGAVFDQKRYRDMRHGFPWLSREFREIDLVWVPTYDGGRYVWETEIDLQPLITKTVLE